MEYNFREIESKWRQKWAENNTFKAEDNSTKPKYYVLDMFPYPSGAGLHVGHPLGYIASDIFARYKRLKGFNVLHPMGYDSFGLPAEQYAIQTGQHPAITTEQNIARYRDQLDKIGFSFDWDREVRTSSPEYYKWTQWIFKQIFNAWYNNDTDKAEHIDTLIARFAKDGNAGVNASSDYAETFTAAEWNAKSEKEQSDILMEYRLAYLADSWVNWCPALGTVLANDEVINGVSERGGHPVEQKLMRQWSMRIKAFAERLLTGLETVDWTDSVKDMQRNWIGKSKGASVEFAIQGSDEKIEVFTTRPDTIFGVGFMVLAPEHPLVDGITTSEFMDGVQHYKTAASMKSERDRQADVKNITGQFTGAYAVHPFTGAPIPVWIGDYVLASYGTGAVMAVPCGDQRDWDFATHFNIPIKNIFQDIDISEGAYAEKEGTIADSDFLSGLSVKKAMEAAIKAIEEKGIGKGKTNYRLRDAIFSRQRYWGEPFPVYYENDIPKLVADNNLPVLLPEVDKYLPTEDGEPPLARAKKEAWNHFEGDRMEYNTMPGWAGSSFYFLRYMDPHNEQEFVSKEKADYWKQVDLYIGGSEHATGHLLYARFWTKFLFDMGFIGFDEPFKKMINQGMILGTSSLISRIIYSIDLNGTQLLRNEFEKMFDIKTPDCIVSFKRNTSILNDPEIIDLVKESITKNNPELFNQIDFSISVSTDQSPIHVDIKYIDNEKLDIDEAKQDNRFAFLKDAVILKEEDGSFYCSPLVEKMSKSKYNVQTPDELVEKFGADTLRMYEMFLGPLEQFKPWDTKGINGVHNFLRKLWKLFYNNGTPIWTNDAPSKESLKTLHRTIKKIEEDLERFSFNTGVSAFMICVNELSEQKCHSKEILEQLLILLSPYAPHISEELWSDLGNEPGSISTAKFPLFNPDHLVEANFAYPVSFNGKMRFTIELPTAMAAKEVEEAVFARPEFEKWTEGKTPKKVIVVPGRIVNIVL